MPTIVRYEDLGFQDVNLGLFAPFVMFGAGLVRQGSPTSYGVTGLDGVELVFIGRNFTFGGGGPLTGRATSCEIRADGELLATITGLDAPAAKLKALNTSNEFYDLLGDVRAEGALGDDIVFTGKGDDMLRGREGNDTLAAGKGDDKLSGGTGDDTISGGPGADRLSGGEGRDTLVFVGQNGVKVSLAKAGVQKTGEGRDRITGFENLTGSDHDDRLTGDALSNDLVGGAGNDTLLSGGGLDDFEGGNGDDVFAFNRLDAGPVRSKIDIRDFRSGEDVIDLSAVDANTVLDGDQAFGFLGETGGFTGAPGQLRWQYFGGPGDDILISGDRNGDGATDFVIQLAVPATGLTAADFIL